MDNNEEEAPAEIASETKTDETTLSSATITALEFAGRIGLRPAAEFALLRLFGREELSWEAWKIKAAKLLN